LNTKLEQRKVVFKFCRELLAVSYVAAVTQSFVSEFGFGVQPLALFVAAWAWCLKPTFLEVLESLTGKVLPWALLKKQSPTAALEFWLFALTDARTAEAILGDIEERLPIIESQRGSEGAQQWLRAQTSDSILQIVWSHILRLARFASLLKKVENFRPW
jgi:hypothetical protein